MMMPAMSSSLLGQGGGDSADPIVARLHASDIEDRIAIMRVQEENCYHCQDYFLQPLAPAPPQPAAAAAAAASSATTAEAPAVAAHPNEHMDVDDDDITTSRSSSSRTTRARQISRSQQPRHQQSQRAQQRSSTTLCAAGSQKSKPVDADCRTKMAEWCAQVIDFCKFSRETVGIGMSYLDRFIASGYSFRSRTALTDRKEYQLAAMTTLMMAIKLNEPLEMETKLLSDLSRGCYTTAEIATMEIDILEALDWRVNGPTPLEFVQHFLAVGLHDTEAANHPAVEATLLDFSRFQTELAIGMPALLSVTPSRIALAAILNSMEGIDDVALNPFERITFLRSIEATSRLDPNARDLRPVRSLLVDGFVQNVGISFQQVATQLGLGAQREEATRAAMSASNSSDGSGPEVSPVCVSANVGAISKKQRCA